MDIFEEFAAIRLDNDAFMRQFDRNHYADAFDSFLKKHTPLFDSIEEQYKTEEDPSQLLTKLADDFVMSAKADYDAQKKAKKIGYLIDQNQLMVIYILPAIREYTGTFPEALIETLVAKWNQTFTQYTIKPGTFEEINGGFKRKLCYVTTAVCLSLGKDENCREIRLLKDYRDGFLFEQADGPELIDEYYDIAPTIVNRINKRPDAKETYQSIYQNYISPCIDLIDQERFTDCKNLYMQMMHVLGQEYLFRQAQTE